MKNCKKGFTLIELLAVIIVLIIIILIAVNMVQRSVNDTMDKTVIANAGSYIKAVNNHISIEGISDDEYDDTVILVKLADEYGIKVSGTKPSSGKLVVKDGEVTDACLIYDDYSVTYHNGVMGEVKKGKCDASIVYDFEFTGEVKTFTVPVDGKYKIELWGAKGGTGATGTTYYGGYGAYTSGVTDLVKGRDLYVYVGGAGQDHASNSNVLCDGGWNGGGAGGQDNGNNDSGGGGGGATDVALTYSDVYYDSTEKTYTRSDESYASRIMVAAGGGGGAWDTVQPGSGSHAGNLSVVGLVVFHGSGQVQNTKGTQTDGYAFGYGQSGSYKAYGDAKGGGGAGYYSGYNTDWGGQGVGGTSYISGYKGCVAITGENDITPKSGCLDGTTDVTCSYHYSGIKFTDAVMKSGSESMPSFTDSSTMTGNNDNGHARITFIE